MGNNWIDVGRRGKPGKPRNYPALKISDKTDAGPVTWKHKIKELDPETHKLTTWVSREQNWVILHGSEADHGNLQDRIHSLRKLQLTVEFMPCLDRQLGNACNHDKPYCL